MIKELMSTRRFAPLFWAQFFAALNDNVLKNALVIIRSTGLRPRMAMRWSPSRARYSSFRSSSFPGSAASLPTSL